MPEPTQVGEAFTMGGADVRWHFNRLTQEGTLGARISTGSTEAERQAVVLLIRRFADELERVR